MSYIVSQLEPGVDSDGEVIDGTLFIGVQTGDRMPLIADKTVDVMPLCFALVTHNCKILIEKTTVIMMPASGTFMDRSLMVGVKLMRDGEVMTEVFNLSNKKVKVRKGEVVSELVGL